MIHAPVAMVWASDTGSVRITPSVTQRSRYSPSGNTTPARCRRCPSTGAVLRLSKGSARMTETLRAHRLLAEAAA